MCARENKEIRLYLFLRTFFVEVAEQQHPKTLFLTSQPCFSYQVPATLFEVRLRIVEQYFKRLNRSRTKCLRIVYSMQEFSVNLNIFY